MPIIVTEVPYRPVPSEPKRVRWTRAEYEALERTGLFEGRNYELVEGELIDKMSTNIPHGVSLAPLLYWLFRVFGVRRVLPETSIDVSPETTLRARRRPRWSC